MRIKSAVVSCAGVVCANMCMLFATVSTSAEETAGPRFRILDLGDLVEIGEGDPGGSIAFAVNSLNQVTGMAQDLEGEWKAFIWLPSDAYGLKNLNPVNGTRMWSLGTLLSNNSERSVGLSINDDGWIAGTSHWNEVSASDPNAFVWDSNPDPDDNPATPPPGASDGVRKTPLYSLRDTNDYLDVVSVAMDISEEDNGEYHVVGFSAPAEGGDCDTTDFRSAFHTTVSTGDANPLVVRPGGGEDRHQSFALAVNGAMSKIGGHIDTCGHMFECGDGLDPATWQTTSVTPASSQRDFSGESSTEFWDSERGYIFDINDAGEMVGRIEEHDGPTQACNLQRPALWPALNATPIPLPHAGVAMACYAINNNQQAVGAKGTANVHEMIDWASLTPDLDNVDGAVLWEYLEVEPDVWEWQLTDLSEPGILSEECGEAWTLLAALDINDAGVICGVGEHGGLLRAFLLVPFDCAEECIADLVPDCGDGKVTVADILYVIAAFGQPCTDCPQDISPPGDPTPANGCDTGDDDVTVSDILAVVTSFGEYCYDDVVSATSDSALALQVMDFSSGYPNENGTIQDFDTEVAAAWSTFSQNYDVYRLWVELDNETDVLEAVSSWDEEDVHLVLTNKAGTFYNNVYGGNGPPNPDLFETHAQLAFDTFVTIGSATNAAGLTILGTLDLTQDVFDDNVAWYKLGGVSPVAGGSTGWRVLIGQFAIPKGKKFSGAALLTGDGIDEYATFSSEE